MNRTAAILAGLLVLVQLVAIVAVPGCSRGDDHGSDFVATTPPPPPPATFQLVSPAAGAANLPTRPTFTWTALAGATNYTLQVSTDNDFLNLVINQMGITGTSFIPEQGLPAGRGFLWRVDATTPTGTVRASNAPLPFTVGATVGSLFPIGGTLRDIVFDSTRNRVYISNQTLNRIEVYDVPTHTMLAPFAVGFGPWGIDLTPDNSRLVVCLTGEARIAVVDLNITPPFITYVDVPADNFGTQMPRTVAVAKDVNGVAGDHRAFFTCVNPNAFPNNQTRVRQLNLAGGPLTVTQRTQMEQGFTRDITAIAASRDRSRLIFGYNQLIGDNPAVDWGRVFFYQASNDTFTNPNKVIDNTIEETAANFNGSLFGILPPGNAPGPSIIHSDQTQRGRVQPGNVRGFTFTSSSTRAYRGIVGASQLGVVGMDTAINHFVEIDRIPIAGQVAGAMTVNETGTLVFAIGTSGLLVVTATSNRPPVIEAVNTLNVTVGQSVSFKVQAVDLDGDPLAVFAPAALPAGATLNPATRVVAYSPAAAFNGAAAISVSDGIFTSSINVTFNARVDAQNVAHRLPLVGDLRDLVFDKTRSRVYISNFLKNRIEVVQVGANSYDQLDSIPVGSSPVGIDLSADDSLLFVATSDSNYIQYVNLMMNPPVVTSLPLLPGTARHKKPWDVATASNGLAFFSANWAGSPGGSGNGGTAASDRQTNVWSVDPTTNTVTARVAPAGLPGGDLLDRPFFLKSSNNKQQLFGSTPGGVIHRYDPPTNAFTGPRREAGRGGIIGLATDQTGGRLAFFGGGDNLHGILTAPVMTDWTLRAQMTGNTTGFAYRPSTPVGFRGISGSSTILRVDTNTTTTVGQVTPVVWQDDQTISTHGAVTGTMEVNSVAIGAAPVGSRLFAIGAGPAAGIGGLLLVRTDIDKGPVWDPIGGIVRINAGQTVALVVRASEIDDITGGATITYNTTGTVPAFVSFSPATRTLTMSPSVAHVNIPPAAIWTVTLTAQEQDNEGTGNVARYTTNLAIQIRVTNTAADQHPMRTIPIGGPVNTFELDPAQTRVYVTNAGRNQIDILEHVSANSVRRLDPIRTLGNPQGLDVSADGTRLLVCPSGSNFVQIFDITVNPPVLVAEPMLPQVNTSIWARPFSAAAVMNGTAVVGLFNAPGGERRLYQVDIAAGTASLPATWPTTTYETPVQLMASPDHERVIIGEPRTGTNPATNNPRVRLYFWATDTFGTRIDIPGPGSSIPLNRLDANLDGTFYLVSSGPRVLDDAPTVLASLGGQSQAAAFRHGTVQAYRHNNPGADPRSVDRFDWTTFGVTGFFNLPGAPEPEPPTGMMKTNTAGTQLTIRSASGITIVTLPP